jgi:hypothetical protein
MRGRDGTQPCHLHLSDLLLIPHPQSMAWPWAGCWAGLGSGQMCDPRCRQGLAQLPELKTDANSRTQGVACAFGNLCCMCLFWGFCSCPDRSQQSGSDPQ